MLLLSNFRWYRSFRRGKWYYIQYENTCRWIRNNIEYYYETYPDLIEYESEDYT